MTRPNLRGRLRALEVGAARKQDPRRVYLWGLLAYIGTAREARRSGEEEKGQSFPMSPADLEDVRASGQHVVMLTGLPHGVRS